MDKDKKLGKTTKRSIRVCYFGTYRRNYSRNQIMIEGLRRNGVEVIECHQRLWYGIEDRVRVAGGGWLKPAFWLRVLRTYIRLIRQHKKLGRYDVMVVGYPGQIDIYLAHFLSWKRRVPVVWDIFMSIYLIAQERHVGKESSLSLRMINHLERGACHLADLLILDTEEYACWFKDHHGTSLDRVRLVPTGADDRIFQPLPHISSNDEPFIVLYYGTFIPNHGVEYIIAAARLLDRRSVHFELIGDGPLKDEAIKIANRYQLSNMNFIPWLESSELVNRVAKADICLGSFGITPQALMTVQNKIYEALAMAKPIITGDSPAIRKFFQHGKHVYLCERANPEALATSIDYLHKEEDLRKVLSKNGNICFRNHYSTEHIGSLFMKYLLESMNKISFDN